VPLPGGRYLAAWFAGTREGESDTAIWGAVRTQEEWSPPRLLAKVSGEPHWNPVLFIAPDGRIYLWFKTGAHPNYWKTWLMYGDNGETWSEPEPFHHQHPWPRGPVKNKPIVLQSGAWLAPASIEWRHEDGRETWGIFVDRSNDGGHIWQCTELLRSDESAGHIGAIQPALWESRPGQVHMLMRTREGFIARSDSTDGGHTWTPIYPTELPNNNSGLDIARLPNGALALAYNPVEARLVYLGPPPSPAANLSTRSVLRLALSFDNGHTWPRYLDIENEDGEEFSYPAMVAAGDGVAVTYTWKRRGICFWKGGVKDIPEGG
jgi:predicted neuraminidase